VGDISREELSDMLEASVLAVRMAVDLLARSNGLDPITAARALRDLDQAELHRRGGDTGRCAEAMRVCYVGLYGKDPRLEELAQARAGADLVPDAPSAPLQFPRPL
jgi:hypothetical protein